MCWSIAERSSRTLWTRLALLGPSMRIAKSRRRATCRNLRMRLVGNGRSNNTPLPRRSRSTTLQSSGLERISHWCGTVWRRRMAVRIAQRVSRAAERRQKILDRISRAATVAKRGPAEVTLIAVSKGRSVDDIEALIGCGQRDFAENRVQEALGKWPPLLARYPDVVLHGIGRLQSNKADDAVNLFDTIQSLDRRALLEALVKEAGKVGRTPNIYVQVNIGEEEQKGGCSISEVGDLVEAVRASPLQLAGLMAIPPLQFEPAPFFALLATLGRRHDVAGLSIGMSGDFEAAVMLGATVVRIGTALFEDER